MADRDNLPEVLEHDFIICDESVNRYYWRLLVGGIDLDGFLKNPVCVIQHETSTLSIGKWKNVRVEGDKLLGTLEFDKNDDVAVDYYLKYKNGYMNAVSLHVIPIEESDAKELLLPGQKYPTLVKSELIEVSVVTIGGNKNAVKLCNPDGTEYKLSIIEKQKNTEMADDGKTVDQLQADLEAARALNVDNLIVIHKNRGVLTDAEEPSVRKLAASNYDATKQMLESRQPQEPKPDSGTETGKSEAEIEAVLLLHLNRGAITAQEKDIYKNNLKLDFDATSKILEAKKGKEVLNNFTQHMGQEQTQNNERENWTYLDYYKKDQAALWKMQTEEPDKYRQLEADFTNVDPNEIRIS